MGAVFQDTPFAIESAGNTPSILGCPPLVDTDLFDEMWPRLAAKTPAAEARGISALARRARTGEIVLAIGVKGRLHGLGIIQSDPKPDTATGASYREVQWLRMLAEEPLLMPEELPPGIAGKFRGSAMQLVEEVFEGTKH